MSDSNYITEDEILSSPQFATHQLGKQLGSTMILAPHPDDESLGCGGLIQYLIQQDTSVRICFITSGEASHPNSVKYPKNILMETREMEAINACKILGVEKSNIIFLREPDSFLNNLEYEQKKVIALKLSELIKHFKIVSLIVPWRRDPHSDHRATFEIGKIAKDLSNTDIQIIEYPIWLWKNSNREDWPLKEEVEVFRLEISEMLPKKKMAIYAHTSQTTNLIEDDAKGFILSEDLISPFLTSYEYYLFSSDKPIKSLKKEYFDILYSQNSDPWNFRNSEYEKSKYKTIDSYLKNQKFENGLELGCSIGVHTSFLASHCENLLAVDISEEAIETAKNTNYNVENVKFKTLDIQTDFPKGAFDFISMCEIGYYFTEDVLKELYKKITDNLNVEGYFLMVHWSSFVQEYPLSGKKVRLIFEDSIQSCQFEKISFYEHESYELLLWKKTKE